MTVLFLKATAAGHPIAVMYWYRGVLLYEQQGGEVQETKRHKVHIR